MVDAQKRKDSWRSGRRAGGVEPAAESEQQRKSPELRREPLRMLVPDFRVRISEEDAQLFKLSKPRGGEAELSKRDTPLARRMVEDVPGDGAWYLAAICFSQGQATALASHIARGGYGGGVSAARGPMPNKNKDNSGREPWCLLLKRTKQVARSS